MIEFMLEAESSASAEEVMAAARDFTERRIRIWPNVSATGYEVHESGESHAEVTEKALKGLAWERSRYEWTGMDSIRQTVIESNVLASGSTWEMRAVSDGTGCRVEATFRRDFRGTPMGLFAHFLNRFVNSVYGSDLKKMLAAVEDGVGSEIVGGTRPDSTR